MARYALVIGITANDASLGTLSHPLADAGAIADVLRTYGGFRVEVLTQPEETTARAIAAKLKEFFQVRSKGQEALLFFSGHGFPLVDEFGEVEAFLAPSDCVVEWGADAKGNASASAQRNGLALRSVSALAARAELSNLVMLLDCCHSGYLLEESLLKQTFAAFIQKDYWLMTACRSFESAWAKRSDPYSLFTGAVLKGLAADRADESGAISVGELFAFIPKALKGEPQEVMQLAIGRPIELVKYRLETVSESIVPTLKTTNPYQGLNAFTAETRQFFFGRDREIQTLVQKVQDCKFVPVIGASGSGKSSVVRAGLIPRLEELGWRVLPVMMPGTGPIATLQSTIDSLEDSTENTLLVVDQFEEVFTLCRDRSEQSKFIQALMSLKLRVVVTMRADFVEACLADSALTRSIQADAVYLGPMVGEALEAAIEQPAIGQGAIVQPRLLAQILQDVEAEENCLPLLEFALSQLWERQIRSGPLTPNSGGTEPKSALTLEAYRQLGGVVGALDAHAEGLYKTLASQKREQWVKPVMLRLVRTGEGTKDTRQRQRKSDLLEMGKDSVEREAIEAVINALVDRRLLVSDRIDNQDVIDLSHEALMRSWKRLVTWRESDREVRRIVDAIEDRYKEWLSSKDDESLLMGRLLRESKENWRVLESQINQKIQEFYFKSLKHDKDYQISSVTTIRGHRSGVTDGCILDYVRFISLSRDKNINLWNIYTGKLIKRIETIEHNGRIVIDPSRKVLLILDKKLSSRKSLMKFIELTDFTKILDYSQDNNYISEVCSGSKSGEFIYALDNGQIKKISILSKDLKKEGKNLLTIRKGNKVTSMLFLQEFKALALATSDYSIEIYSLATKKIIFTLKGHTQIINSLASSIDGRFLVSCSDDQTIRVWSLETGFILHTIDGHTDTINSVSIIGDQYSIASASTDNTVKIWKLDENQLKYNCRYTLYEHTDWINGATFCLSEDRIISLSEDRTIKYSNLKNRIYHLREVKKIRLTLDGLLMSFSSDKTIKFWDILQDQLVLTLSGKSPVLDSISINNGDAILYTSTDNSLRIWNLASQSLTDVIPTKYIVYGIDIFSDKQVILICGDKKLRVFDYIEKDFVLDFEQDLDGLRVLAVPKMKGVVVAEADFVIRLKIIRKNVDSKLLLEFRGHESVVTALSICQQQKLLASGDASGEIRIWSLQTGVCIHTIQGHGNGWIYSLSVRYSNITKNQIELLSSGDDQSLRLWNLSPESTKVSIFNDVDNITSCILSENKIMFANHSGRVEWLYISDFPAFS